MTAARLAVALLVLAALTPALAAPADELTVSVAVSMKDAAEEIGRLFVRAHPGTVVRHNFGASGELQKQIEAGAPVDVFVSAAARQMDELQARRLVVAATRRTVVRNALVAIVPSDSRVDVSRPAALTDAGVTRIAIGNPRTVPVGQYAEEALRALGLWTALTPKLVLADNVRQVLDYVSRGEVDAGFVYATDAATRAGRVKEAFRPPPASHHAIEYPAAVVTASPHAATAAAYVEFLVAPPAQGVLRRLGFVPAADGG